MPQGGAQRTVHGMGAQRRVVKPPPLPPAPPSLGPLGLPAPPDPNVPPLPAHTPGRGVAHAKARSTETTTKFRPDEDDGRVTVPHDRQLDGDFPLPPDGLEAATARLRAARVVAAPPAQADDIIQLCENELRLSDDPARSARLHFAMARAYRDDGKALAHYRRALELVPEHLPSLRAARRILVSRRDGVGAVELLDREIRLAPDARERARLLYVKARVLEEGAHQADGALGCYRQAVELDPSHPTLLLGLEHAEARAERWQELERALEGAANAVREDPVLRAALVVERAKLVELRLAAPERAVELYERALEIDPQAAGALGALKRLLQAQKRWRELNQVLEREAAQAADPELAALALYRVGMAHSEQLGSRDDAVAALTRAMHAAPQDPLVHETLAALYQAAGDDVNLVTVLAHHVETLRIPSERLGLLQRLGELCEKRLEDVERAVGWYEAALSIDATYAPALHALDSLYSQLGRWQPLIVMHLGAAEKLQDKARRAHAHARIAQIFEEELSEPDQAVRHHVHALVLDPSLEGSFKALTRLYAAFGRHRELVELYERAIERTSDRVVVMAYLFKIGALYEDALAEPAHAIGAYRRVLDIDPDHVGALHAWGRAAERAERHDDLVAALEREATLVSERPRKVALYVRAGEVLARAADHDGALLRFKRALDLDGRSAAALAGLGRLYHRMGRYEDQREVYLRQIELAAKPPEKVALLFKVGELCEHELAKDEEATAFYRQASTLDPSHTPSLAALERQLRRQGDSKGLVGLLQVQLKAASDPETRARIAFRMGEVYELSLEQVDRAAAAYEQALAAWPGYPPSVDALGRVRTRLKDWARLAQELLEEAQRARDPARAVEALLRSAELHGEMLGKPQEAIACYEEVLARQPNNVAALLRLATLYRHAGAWQPLVHVYRSLGAQCGDIRLRVALLEELARLYETRLAAADEQRQVYEAILAIDPSHPRALESLERLARAQGDDALLAAVDVRAAQSEVDATLAAAHAARLGAVLEHSDAQAASEAYQAALGRDPENIAAIHGLRRCAERLAEPRLLVDSLLREAAWTRSGRHAAGVLVQAARVLLERLEDGRGAIEAAEQALERDADSAAAAALAEDLLKPSGRVDQLLALLTRAAGQAREPARVAALWCAVARLCASDRGDMPAALAALERAEEAGIDNPTTLRFAGDLRARLGHWEQAVSAYRRALEKQPPPSEAVAIHLQLARFCTRELDDTDAAVASLREVLRHQPRHRDALVLLLEIETRRGNASGRRNALAALLDSTTGARERAWGLLEMARIDLSEGRHREAAQALYQAVVLEGPHGDGATLYKTVLGDSEPWERYIEALREHVQRVAAGELEDDRLRDSYVAMARIEHEVLLRVDDAVKTLRAGLKACGDDTAMRLELAERLGAAGRVEESVAEYQRMVQRDPTAAEAWRGMARAFHEAGRKLHASIALAPLVVLGSASEIERGLARTRRVQAGWAQPGSFDAAALIGMSAANPRDDERMSAALGYLAESIAKLYPVGFEQYGVSVRERITDGPLRETCDRLAQAFGVQSYDLYQHRAPVRDVVTELSVPPAIMVPEPIAERVGEAQRAFLLARAFAAVALGFQPVITLGRNEIVRLMAAAMSAVAPGLSSRFGEEELAPLHKRLYKGLSRRNRRAFETLATETLVADPVDVERWAERVELTVARAAALVANDLASAVEALRMVGTVPLDAQGPGVVRSSALVADLLLFWTSPAAFERRRLAGML
jgi:tetratricopeptide (TPR) repeat protein